VREVLRAVWEGWKAVASRIGHVQTWLILSLIYFVVMLPAAVGVRVFGDPLGLKARPGSTRWRRRDHPAPSFEQARRQ